MYELRFSKQNVLNIKTATDPKLLLTIFFFKTDKAGGEINGLESGTLGLVFQVCIHHAKNF